MSRSGLYDDIVGEPTGLYDDIVAPRNPKKAAAKPKPSFFGSMRESLEGVRKKYESAPGERNQQLKDKNPIASAQLQANRLAQITGKTTAPATTVSGAPRPNPKAASGMDIANMANELQDRMSKAVKPYDPPDWMPNPLLGALSFVPGVKEVTKPSNAIPGIVLSGVDIAGDAAAFADRNSTREQQLGALANIVIKTPLAAAGGGIVLKGASKGLQLAFDAARNAKNTKALTQVLKQAEKQGVDIESLAKGFKTEPANPKKLPTTQPTPSGVSAKAKREVKPVVKPVEEAKAGTAEVTPIKTEDITPNPPLKGAKVSKVPDAPDAPVYHGSPIEFDELSDQGLYFTGESPSAVGKYAANGGAGARQSNAEQYFVDNDSGGIVYQKGKDDLWHPIGEQDPETGRLIRKDTGETPKTQDQLDTIFRNWQGSAMPSKQYIYEAKPPKGKVADLIEPDDSLYRAKQNDRKVAKELLGDLDPMGNPIAKQMIEAAKNGEGFSWRNTTLLSKNVEGSLGHTRQSEAWKIITDQLRKKGYVGIRFADDGTVTRAFFDKPTLVKRTEVLSGESKDLTPPTPPKATPESPKGAKEPWEMRFTEARKGRGIQMGDNAEPMMAQFNKWDAEHKQAVESALKEGKPVPAEVLADYPDLAAKYGGKGAKEAGGLYHGSDAGLRPGATLRPTQEGNYGPGVYLTRDKDYAKHYAPTTGNVVDVDASYSNPLDFFKKYTVDELPPSRARDVAMEGREYTYGDVIVARLESEAKTLAAKNGTKVSEEFDVLVRELGHDAIDFKDGINVLSPKTPVRVSPKPTPKPLESIGGPPREIPLSKPTGEIPKVNPKKVVEAPKVEPKADVPETPSGLSRSSRAVLADVYGTNKPTSIGGKSLDELYESGRKKLNEGFDAEAEMDALAKAGRPATDEEIGAFSVYRDDLIGQLDLLERKLKGGSDDVVSERLDLLEKVAAFDRNLDEVKGAGGRSLNAFKIGHKVAWDNLNEVLIEAKRYKPVSAGREAQFRDLTGKQAEQAERITRLEKELAEVKATGVTAKSRGKATVEKARMERAEVFKELDELLKSSAGKTHDIGSAAYDALRASKIAGRIAITYIKEGVGTLDEAVSKVIADFAERGIKVSAQDIYDDIDNMTVTRDRSEIQKQVAKLRQEAKNLSSRARLAKEASEKAKYEKMLEGTQKRAADLQKQLETGEFRIPTKREKIITKELEDARAEKALYAAKVQAALRAHAAPIGKKVVKEVAGAIRGTILGSDIGVLTRQGLFGLSRPGAFVKGLGKGLKALASEKNLVKIENDILSHKVGGQTAGVVYRKAGLSLSSHLTNPEEMVIGKLLSRIPGAGALGRAQTAFINTLRSETMDRAIRLGYKENELAARANFINSATGRSNAKNVPTALEVIMTSPRYERSRWEMLAQPFRNPALIVKDAVTGKGLNRGAVDNIQDMAITAAEIYGLYKLTEASGYEVEWDPTSSDFLKMRKGDEVWDPSAGLAPRIRDAMRFVVWGMNPTYQHNVSKVVSQTVLRPVSPAIKQPVELGSQQVQRARGVPEDKMASFFTGWKIDEDEKGWITFAPLIIQTAKKYLDEGDREGAASAAFREWIGQSVNKYPKPNPKK